MNFEKDVFISYAHIDDDPLIEGMKGWITEFHTALEVRISQILGEHPKIWRDSKLQGNDFFSPEIESQFPKLKLMISIVTPRYVKSEWCTKEVDLFSKAAASSGGLVVDNKSRIFKIVKTPVDLDIQPPIMKPLLGYEFYRVDPQTKRPTEFGVRGKEKDIEIQYWTKLDDVAYDVAQLISKLDQVTVNPNDSTPPPMAELPGVAPSTEPYTKRNIYLAETSYDMDEYRDNLKRELENKGFTVFPNKNIKPVASVYKSEVTSMMSQCSLSVHLIGSSYGLIPDGGDQSVMVIQNDLAAEQSKSNNLNRLIWAPELTPSEDPRLINFLEKIKLNDDLQKGSDLLHGTIEEFKFAIFDTLKELDRLDKEKQAQKDKAVIPSTGGGHADTEVKTIYIVCDQRDLSAVQAIDDCLYDSGFNVYKSIFEGTQEELSAAHEDSLRDCDAVLIYYGNANEAWLRAKISELKRKPALTDARPLLGSMVYLGDPSTASKAAYRSRDVQFVVNGLAGFQPALLTDFINKLH